MQGHRNELLKRLRAMSPAGFERLCQRLLQKLGYENVKVTGRSGDGGIDGQGILQVRTFLNLPIYFQCKRYSGAVGSPEVRNFRGAMVGRAQIGIILTTGTFTRAAQLEAVRDGAPRIELVDGERLVDTLEKLKLGLRQVTTFEVEDDFFEEFSRTTHS